MPALTLPESGSADASVVRALVGQVSGHFVQLLLDAGANPDELDDFREGPLHVAAYLGNYGGAKALLDAGATVGLEGRGVRPIDLAAIRGHLDIVQLLKEHGAVLSDMGITMQNRGPLYSPSGEEGSHDPSLGVRPAALDLQGAGLTEVSEGLFKDDGGWETNQTMAESAHALTCTVRVFRKKFTLEDAIGSHACSLQASRRVTNDIPLWCPLFLPIHPVNCVQTLKATEKRTLWMWLTQTTSNLFQIVSSSSTCSNARFSSVVVPNHGHSNNSGAKVRCSGFGRNSLSRSAIEFHAFAPLEALPCV
jgi:hypothetical protein